jgi:hypothetical protein
MWLNASFALLLIMATVRYFLPMQSYIVETPMRLDWEKRLTMDRFVMDRLFNLQVTH